MTINLFAIPLEMWSIALMAFLLLLRLAFQIIVYGAPIRQHKRMRKGKLNYCIDQEPVSVIVYSKYGFNEIEKIIHQLCSQRYPTYEVIFVLNKEHKLPPLVEQQLKESHPNLYFTYYPDQSQVQSRYKLALIIGLKAAKFNHILVTQSHCLPSSDRWIELMARNMVKGIEIVIGVTHYNDSKSSMKSLDAWIGNLLRIRSYTLASLNKSNSAFGSNLMFSKSLYLNEHFIKSNLRQLHGEDDLFINMCSTKKNCRIEIDPLASTTANVKEKSWITHRLPSIYLATQKFYTQRKQQLFVVEQLLNYLFYLTSIIAVWMNGLTAISLILLGMILLSTAIELYINYRNSIILHQTYYPIKGLLYRLIAPILFNIERKYKHNSTRYE